MTEEGGDGVYIHAIVYKSHSECVPKAMEGDMFLNLGEFEEPRDVETQFITRQIGKHQTPLFVFAEQLDCRG